MLCGFDKDLAAQITATRWFFVNLVHHDFSWLLTGRREPLISMAAFILE